MMIFLILAIFTILLLSIYDYFNSKKLVKDSENALKKFDRIMEGYNFLLSDDGLKAQYEVESLCNQLGIKLESEMDDEEDVLI